MRFCLSYVQGEWQSSGKWVKEKPLLPSMSKTVQWVRKLQQRENTHWDYSHHSNDKIGLCKRNVEFDVSHVASALQTSDYFLSLCQKPPGTAKVYEWSVVNVKDNGIENGGGGQHPNIVFPQHQSKTKFCKQKTAFLQVLGAINIIMACSVIMCKSAQVFFK